MTRLAIITGWLLAGHALLAAAYWGLLNVPESSAATLALSALLASAIVIGASGVYAGALLGWDRSRPALRALASGFPRFYWMLPAALVFGAFWWVAGRLHASHAGARGAIDAVMMAKLGWADTSLVHIAIDDAVVALQWVVGLSLAVGVFAAGVTAGARGVKAAGWLKRSLDPRTLSMVAAIEILLVVLPWHHVYWRPRGLQLGAEPLFVGAKLGLMACLAAVAGALIARTASRGWRLTDQPKNPPERAS